MLKDNDLELLYSLPEGKAMYRIKWILIGLILITIFVASMLFNEYNSLSVKNQLSMVIWGHNILTVGSAVVSFLVGLFLTTYIMIERKCVRLVMYGRHKELTKRLKNCLKTDKRR